MEPVSTRTPVQRFSGRVRRVVAIVGPILLAAWLLAHHGSALLLVFAGVLAAVLLRTAARSVADRTAFGYGGALAIVVAAAVTALVALGVLLGPQLAAQLHIIAEKLPAVLHHYALQVQGSAFVKPFLSPSPPGDVLRTEPKTILVGMGGIAASLVEAAGALVVVFFLGVYGAASPGVYANGLLRLVPPPKRARAKEVLHETVESLGRWLLGRLFAMILVGILTSLGLEILGVPLALSLGVLAGLATFVEYLGAITSAIPPILLAWTISPTHAVWVLALFVVIHVIDGYLLSPMLARRMTHLPPAFTLAAQVLFGSVFGLAGLTFATPLCVVVVTLVRALYVEDALGDRRPVPPVAARESAFVTPRKSVPSAT